MEEKAMSLGIKATCYVNKWDDEDKMLLMGEGAIFCKSWEVMELFLEVFAKALKGANQ